MRAWDFKCRDNLSRDGVSTKTLVGGKLKKQPQIVWNIKKEWNGKRQ